MALYENGKRISGIRDFPAYTWDEYHALPVAKRPRIWNCTDRDYTDVLTADDIQYNGGTVADTLDALTATLGTYIEVTSFPYTIPCNGYIRTFGDGSSQSERWYQCNIGYISLIAASGNDVRYFTKGMSISQKSSGLYMYFYPLNQ